ncbi:MAG TPA: methyltransferase domain-containing protein [Chthonomonadaceae bacterium]|nr:methyltransferase domain-containing protein [Chthonomonadaceae bacterium]
MSLATDAAYLREKQYRNADNLNARVALHAQFSVNPYGWHRWVFDQFDLPTSCHILELGCGPGMLWLRNRERIPATWNILLSDFSPGMLQEAQANLSAVAHPFAFQVCDAQAIPLPDAAVDAVIANHMLYHVPDRNAAFSEIRRVLKPHGTLFAATNGHDHLLELAQLQQRCGLPHTPVMYALGFTLETGAEQLAPWFQEVTLLQYEDALRVTQAEPLLAYIRSEFRGMRLSDDQVQALRDFLEQELAREGVISIRKSTGLFRASSDTEA